MSLPALNNKITISFFWIGPNSKDGGWSSDGLDAKIVDLVFKGAKSKISVHLPACIHPVTAQKFPFTCIRPHRMPRERVTNSLRVTVEQIQNLTIRVGIFEKGRSIGPIIKDLSTGKITQQKTIKRNDRNVPLEMPKKIEIGQTYRLVVTSEDLSLTARLIKEKKNAKKEEGKIDEEFLKRLNDMGKALLKEGERNHDLASKGAFDSFHASDVIVHFMTGLMRAGQKMHPGFAVPHATPTPSPSDLDKLSVEELRSQWHAVCKKDKELGIQLKQVAKSGNIPRLNEIVQAEVTNTQLLANLMEALQRKTGEKVQLP